jgi:predicted AAA+ superfamily ATPase
MLRRKTLQTLKAWKQNKTQQAFMLSGARQVGKTTTVRAFAKLEYPTLAEVNFYGNPTAISTVSKATDASDLLFRLSVLTGKKLEPGETLLFLDEIQECQDLLTWVKFLSEISNIDIVLSGSLLGLDAFMNVRSMPVGFLQKHEMYPLDFEEFCWANELIDDAFGVIKDSCWAMRPVPDFLHEMVMDLFRRYLLIGGMPDAVQAYINKREIVPVRNAQAAIAELYEDDVAKYVTDATEARQIKMVYEAIPGQLNAPSKRFKYTRLGKHLRFANLETAFDWLAQAKVALPCTRIGNPSYPVGLSEDVSAFKLFMNDVGILTSQLMGNVAIDIINHKENINFGSIYENAVAQELTARGVRLHYYSNKRIGEVDFIVENRSMGKVSVVEVKSGKDYKRHNALANMLQVKEYEVDAAVVLYDGNVRQEKGITYLPVYMASMLVEDTVA